MSIKSAQDLKKLAGATAATLIEEGMLVGLGTGSTAACFIEALIERCRNGLSITVVATSDQSIKQAIAGGIPTVDIQTVSKIDLTVDGADEIDPQKRMIKGGGGALLREKIVASASDEMVVIVDESKHVECLGAFGLPVELIHFGIAATVAKVEQLGFTGKLRKQVNGELYLTDNGNYIYDIAYPNLCQSPEKDHEALLQIPGVVETGFFFNLAGRVVTAHKNGDVKIHS